ncbi:hypothetical protein PGT21_016300 [Puccinia graminis f. sp. tritici]|uniref:Uncharacterized protein n=1 Tax=Puccinia graminis f. sp. tritici TaxID=56615 RepID=A0A5B0N1Z1_PUCGR|nr:hypothetical protein PGTUg99_013667 [Puccinia graminis f. sp. tritici]KAA1094281.1 hypothetical protein PGT21_016300 [Puccinia graminis f. sp. tritici]
MFLKVDTTWDICTDGPAPMFGRNWLAQSSLPIKPSRSNPAICLDQLIGHSLAQEETGLPLEHDQSVHVLLGQENETTTLISETEWRMLAM